MHAGCIERIAEADAEVGCIPVAAQQPAEGQRRSSPLTTPRQERPSKNAGPAAGPAAGHSAVYDGTGGLGIRGSLPGTRARRTVSLVLRASAGQLPTQNVGT